MSTLLLAGIWLLNQEPLVISQHFKQTETIEKVPAEIRWEIDTKGMTGACTAMLNVIKGALGPEKFEEFQVGLWSQAAKGAKQLADTVGLTIETPRDIDEARALLAVTSMGPEFEFKTFVRRMISVDICALLDSPNTESQIMR